MRRARSRREPAHRQPPATHGDGASCDGRGDRRGGRRALDGRARAAAARRHRRLPADRPRALERRDAGDRRAPCRLARARGRRRRGRRARAGRRPARRRRRAGDRSVLLRGRPARSRRGSTPTSRAAGSSTCGRPPSARCGGRASRPSTGSTGARAATRISSSRTAAPGRCAACRACSVLSPAELRERYDRIRAEVGPGVTVVATTKYVALADLAVIAEAGIEVVGENRVQDLEAKHAEYGDTFRWHFIGRLQSNKVKPVNRICELVHSLDSDSAARRLEIPALVQVNLAGEESKGGVAPADVPGLLGGDVRGLSTMPPAAARSGGVPPVVPATARARGGARPRRPVDGHDPGLPRRRRGGRHVHPRRQRPLPVAGLTPRRRTGPVRAGRLWTKRCKVGAKDSWRPRSTAVIVDLEGGGVRPHPGGGASPGWDMSRADMSAEDAPVAHMSFSEAGPPVPDGAIGGTPAGVGVTIPGA